MTGLKLMIVAASAAAAMAVGLGARAERPVLAFDSTAINLR